MYIQKRWFAPVLTAFCFCLVLSALSTSAMAVSVGDSIISYCRSCGSSKAHTVVSIVSPATCSAYAVFNVSCDSCHTSSNTLDPEGTLLPHNFRETSRRSATCISTGTSYQKCSRCNATQTEILPALGGDHAWTETSRTPATCTAAGSVSSRCSKCSETKTESLPVLGHDWTETHRIPASCLIPGSIEYSCSRCSDTKLQ